MREPFPPCLGDYEGTPFRAPRVSRPSPIWPLLIILAATLVVVFGAAARCAIGGL